MPDELSRMDAIAQAELVASGEVSALELVDAAIARIEELDSSVHAVTELRPDRARARARESLAGPLAGVPFLVKDAVPYPGMRFSLGSRLLAQHTAQEHSPYTQRLDDAGLVVLGKSATSELGLLGSTETLLEGVTHNPWDLSRSAGGSSGGAAAAVAAGLVPVAHASDGGGSIRLPASMNGLFGFKPGARRTVPATPSDMEGVLVEHCVSWSVRDSALLLSLTEHAGDDAIGFVESGGAPPLRIGVYSATCMGQEPEESVQHGLDATADMCASLGHAVQAAKPPPVSGELIGDVFFTLAGEACMQLVGMMEPILGRDVDDRDLEPFTLATLDWFRGLPAGAGERARANLASIASTMNDYLKGWDVVLSPTMPVEVYPLGTLAPTKSRDTLMKLMEELAGYTALYNPAGAPAMSVPLCMSKDGLPVGMHFAAPRGAERRLLELAYDLEEAAPWAHRRPSLSC